MLICFYKEGNKGKFLPKMNFLKILLILLVLIVLQLNSVIVLIVLESCKTKCNLGSN